MKIDDIPIFDSLVHVTSDGEWYGTDHSACLGDLMNIYKSVPSYRRSILAGLPGQDPKFIFDCASNSNEKLLALFPFTFDYIDLFTYLKNIKESGFIGIKLHPIFLKCSLDDNRIINVIRFCGILDLVVFLCTNRNSSSIALNQPVSEVLFNICLKSDGAKIVLVHGGGYDLLATAELVKQLPHVLIDLSSTLPRFIHSELRFTFKYLFSSFDERICIGSDFPEYTIVNVVNCIKEYILPGLNLEKEKLKNIFYRNLDYFLRIT